MYETYNTLKKKTIPLTQIDPWIIWIIAHAINEEATVVTQENKETAINSKRIKIPNVCENMGVRWINDFQMIKELEIQFKCNLK